MRLGLAIAVLLLAAGVPVAVEATEDFVPVDIIGNSFSPATLVVESGKRVLWYNNDGVTHTATTSQAPVAFDTGDIAPSTEKGFVLTQPGLYRYYCKYHGSMTGTVEVQGDVPNQPPTVEIAAPAPDAVVGGTVTVSGTAFDPEGGAFTVELSVGNGPWRAVTGSTSWTYQWDTRGPADGVRSINVRASDGMATGTAAINVTVRNVPTIAIATPAASSLVVGTAASITGTASAHPGADLLVETRVDDGPWTAASGTSAWSNTWDASGAAAGAHTLWARATTPGGVATASRVVHVPAADLATTLASCEPCRVTAGLHTVRLTVAPNPGADATVHVLDDAQLAAFRATGALPAAVTTSVVDGAHEFQAFMPPGTRHVYVRTADGAHDNRHALVDVVIAPAQVTASPAVVTMARFENVTFTVDAPTSGWLVPYTADRWEATGAEVAAIPNSFAIRVDGPTTVKLRALESGSGEWYWQPATTTFAEETAPPVPGQPGLGAAFRTLATGSMKGEKHVVLRQPAVLEVGQETDVRLWVTRHDRTPLADVEVRICAGARCVNGTTNATGAATLRFTLAATERATVTVGGYQDLDIEPALHRPSFEISDFNVPESAFVGKSMTAAAKIKNHGEQEAGSVGLTFFVNGARIGFKRVEIQAGGEQVVPIDFTLSTVGRHKVAVEISTAYGSISGANPREAEVTARAPPPPPTIANFSVSSDDIFTSETITVAADVIPRADGNITFSLIQDGVPRRGTVTLDLTNGTQARLLFTWNSEEPGTYSLSITGGGAKTDTKSVSVTKEVEPVPFPAAAWLVLLVAAVAVARRPR